MSDYDIKVKVNVDTKDVKKSDAEVKNFKKSLSSLPSAGSVASAGIAAVGVAAVAAGAALANAALDGINYADKINDMSARIGLSTETLSSFGYVVKMNGSDIDTLSKGLERLSVNISKAGEGNKTAVALFDSLGISVKNADGSLRAADDVFLDLADRFKEMPNGANETKLAIDLLGKSGLGLVQTLNSGSESIQNMINRARELGVVVSGETAQKAAEFNDKLDDLGSMVQGLNLSLAEELLPSLNKFIDFLSKPEIQEALTGMISLLGDTVEGITDFSTAIQDIPYIEYTAFGGYRAFFSLFNDDIDETKTKMDALRTSSGLSTDYIKETAGLFGINKPKPSSSPSSGGSSTSNTPTIGQNILNDYQANYDQQNWTGIGRLSEQIRDDQQAWFESTQATSVVVSDINMDMDGIKNTIGTTMPEVTTSWADNLKDMGENILPSLAEGFSDAFASALVDGELNFKSFLRTLAKQLISSGIMKLIANLFPALGGSASGDSFNSGVTTFASGGVIGTPTKFMAAGGIGLMGEAGPEAIVPLKRGKDGKLGISSSGGSSSNTYIINNNISVTGSDDPQATADETSKALNKLMETKIKQVLSNEKRAGNSLNPTSKIY